MNQSKPNADRDEKTWRWFKDDRLWPSLPSLHCLLSLSSKKKKLEAGKKQQKMSEYYCFPCFTLGTSVLTCSSSNTTYLGLAGSLKSALLWIANSLFNPYAAYLQHVSCSVALLTINHDKLSCGWPFKRLFLHGTSWNCIYRTNLLVLQYHSPWSQVAHLLVWDYNLAAPYSRAW